MEAIWGPKPARFDSELPILKLSRFEAGNWKVPRTSTVVIYEGADSTPAADCLNCAVA